ncbi:IS630 family transposase, partial [Methylobacterium sp. E-041]|nr:IS630 family transposase [Methylobacterium sp. E-041]
HSHNWLGDRILHSYDDILDRCCEDSKRFVAQPWLIMSIGLRQWAYRL